jgi:cytochrome c oxidase subunit 2
VSNKWWSVLFGVMMLAAVLLFVAAPFVGWWLPKNVASFGDRIDNLFYHILANTGFFFILTEALLVYFMYVYAGRPKAQEHPVGHHYAEKKVFWTSFFKSIARPVSAILHDQHRVELAWTLVPGFILLYIAFAQVSAWQDIKDPANMPKKPDVTMEVSARMFEWHVRYPMQTPEPGRLAGWAANPEADDLHVVNEIHVWKGARVKVFLRTKDVIHSFYIPNLRLKQDALPGKVIPVWFQVKDVNDAERDRYLYNTVPVDAKGKRLRPGDSRAAKWVDGYDPKGKEFDRTDQIWELACAELCGWGHFKMRGKLFVHETEPDYRVWLDTEKARQAATTAE